MISQYRYVIFDIFNLFLAQGYDDIILKLEKTMLPKDLEKYIYELGFPEKLPTFLFDYNLIDTLFRLKDKCVVCFYTRYNEFTTNCILSKLGVKGLFNHVLTPDIHKSDVFDDVIFFSSYEKMGWESYNIKDKNDLVFEKIWSKIK